MDGLPPGAVSPGHYLVPVPGSYLIPGRKTRKTSRIGSRPLSCRRRRFLPPGTALPSSRIVSRRSKQLPTEGPSTPQSTLTLPPMAQAAQLTTLHPRSAQGGGLHPSGCPHPAAINLKS